MPHTFPRPLAASTKGVAGESVAVAILRPRLSTIPRPQLPLSRSAGEGPGVRTARSAGAGLGVRAARSAGAGSGVRAARTFPRPLSVPTKRAEEQGGERSRSDPAPASFNDTESTNQFTPLPQCGSGAGSEGSPQRRSGVEGEGHPLGRGNVRRMTEQNVGPPTQCLLGHGTFPSSSRPLHIGHVPICTPILKDHGNGLKMMHAALYHPSLPGAVIVGFPPAPQPPPRGRCPLFQWDPTVVSTAVEIIRQGTTDRRGYRPVQTIPLPHPPLNEAPAPVKND